MIKEKILELPFLYTLFTSLSGSNKGMTTFVNNYIKPKKGDKILDIGCGPANIINYFSNVDYTGFDISENYINSAKEKYGDKGKFFCTAIKPDVIKDESIYDIAIASGVIHHLTNKEAEDLFGLAYKTLKPGGKLVTLDGCYTKKQSLIKKFILSQDRGKYVRIKDEYKQLAQTYFQSINIFLIEDLLNIPYTHIIMECTKE